MRLMRFGAAAALSGVILIGVACVQADAQSSEAGRDAEAPVGAQAPTPEPHARMPQPPPGLFILPRQPQAAPAEPLDPRGCSYRENKLELLV